MISFTRWTTAEEVVEIPPAFPLYTYSLTPLEQIRQRVDKNEYFLGTLLYPQISQMVCSGDTYNVTPKIFYFGLCMKITK
jgi:hypothetical protein